MNKWSELRETIRELHDNNADKPDVVGVTGFLLNLMNVKDRDCDLLKEQEPVKPVNVRWEMGIHGGNCPKCMNWVQRTYNYCPFCGKAVKWDG